MDLYFMFFQFDPAIKLIFNISYIPKPEDFKELTPELYQAMYAKTPEEDLKRLENQKVLAFLPDDAKVYNRLVNAYGEDLMIVGDKEISAFERTAEIIDRYCEQSGRNFETITDRLAYMAKTLPDVFSEGTPYAIHGKIRRSRLKSKDPKEDNIDL